MKRAFYSFFLTVLFPMSAISFLSPEIQADRTVTFRLKAPDATKVQISGIISGSPDKDLTKGEEGVWSITVGPLAPGIYSYSFLVNGARVPDPLNRSVKKWVSCESSFEIPGTPALLTELQRVPHGTLHSHIYESAAVGAPQRVVVYTPPGYSDRAERRYPVLFLLHGYGDDETSWSESGRANLIADNLLALGKITQMIIVMPCGHPVPLCDQTKDAWVRNGNLMEKCCVEDLVPFIRKNYRVMDARSQNAIIGLSMGGRQSLFIGLKHVDTFAWVGGFSAAGITEPLTKGEFSNLLSSPKRLNKEIKLLWVGCGKKDDLFKENQDFVDYLEKNGIRHVWMASEGEHDWSTWRAYLAEVLPELFKKQGAVVESPRDHVKT